MARVLTTSDSRLPVSARRKHSDTPARPVDPGLGFVVDPQPDDETCGPACLHGIYRHYGDDIPLAQVAAELHRLDGGGTLDVFLANHALQSRLQASRSHLQPRDLRPDLVRAAGRADPGAARGAGGREAEVAAACRPRTRGYDEFLRARRHAPISAISTRRCCASS